MVKKKNEQVVEVRSNMRGGHGDVKINHYFKKDEMRASCRLCAQLELNPGVAIGLHEHLREDEIFIIQRGNALLIEEDKGIEVAAGDAVLTGGGGAHSIKNIGKDPLLITAVIMQYNS